MSAAEKSVPLWMPLNIADYHRDTQHLSALEHGGYFLMLMQCWSTGGSLPADEKRLARIARLSPKEWKQSREIILDFFKLKGGEYRHKRIDAELAKADELIEQKREAGRKSAAARAERALNERSTSVPTGRSTEGQREGNQSQSQSQSQVREQSPTLPPDVRAIMDEGGFVSPPSDAALLRDWYAAGATLEQDILPTVRAVRARLSKAPFKLKVFDAAIREKLAADAAEIERLKSMSRRYETVEREEAASAQRGSC